MKAIVIEGPNQMSLVEAAIPILKPDEVLVRSRAVGICGSDVELYKGTRPHGFYRYPLVPGHEWSGEVAALGERVRGLSVGERVVVEGFLSCGTCRNCRSGLNNLCQVGYDEIGFTRPGGLAEYVAVPARQVHILPPDASFQDAALLEPAAVVAQGFLQVKPRAAETIAVIGDGTIGLLAVQIASLFSPAALFLVGSHDERLAVGQQLGATHVINSKRDDPVHLLHDLTQEHGADLVFEGGSRAAGVDLSIRLAKRGGTIVLEGIDGTGAQLSLDVCSTTLQQRSLTPCPADQPSFCAA